MDKKYDFDGWSSRWDEDRIGFHVERPNPFLLQYWHHLDEIKPKRCLVPLCGKSLDLVWLSEKVETVIGVELVEKAVLDFFREQKIIPEIQKNSPFNAYSHQGLKILKGNFFDLIRRFLPSGFRPCITGGNSGRTPSRLCTGPD